MTLLAALAAGITVVLAAAGWAADSTRRPSNEAAGSTERCRVAASTGAAVRGDVTDVTDVTDAVDPVASTASPQGALGLRRARDSVSRDIFSRSTHAAWGRRPGDEPGAGFPARAVGRRPPTAVRWLVAVALPVVAGTTFGPTAAVALVVVAVAVRAVAMRRVRQRADRLLDQSLPELIDLLVIAASAGQPVPTCLGSVAERAPLPLRPVLVRAHRRVQRGESVAAALTDAGPSLGALGPAVVEALVVAHRTGAPLQPALQRVATVARDRRRRAAEEAARRLPVTLLFPLVCCVLPAFVLLAVVPLLATSLQSLQT